MNYSKIIILIRAKLNITQEEMAKKLDVSFATINRWENGHTIPSKRYIYILEEICKENNIDWRVEKKKKKVKNIYKFV